MIQFIFGVIVGAGLVLGIFYVIFFNVFGVVKPQAPSPDQFVPLQLPPELAKFLNKQNNGQKLDSEPCFGLSLILHFLFQEHKDTRELRRWIHRRVQLELNDLTTRSAASRVVQDIKIRDLTLGSQIPVVKSIQVEKCKMSEDGEGFEELSFFVEVDYKGGFQISVDTVLLLAGDAQLSIKLTHLVGRIRVMFTRQPYPLWAFSFAEMPEIDFKVDSQLQGRQVSYVVPLINQQIRRAIMKKHVWPNYKVRNRPLFPNPLLQPSPQLSAFNHIELNNHGLEITVLKSTRLNTNLAANDQIEVYCTASLDQRPFIHNAEAGSSHSISVLLTIKPFAGDFGIIFIRSVADLGTRAVKVQSVKPDSPAEKFGFKEGDVLLAINSQAIRNERAVTRLLDGLSTDIVVLVERNLSFYIDDEADAIVGTDNDDFVTIEERKPKTSESEIKRSVSDANFRDKNTPSPASRMTSSSSATEKLAELRKSPSDPNIIDSSVDDKSADIRLSTSLPVEEPPFEVFHVDDVFNSPRKTSNIIKPRPQSFKIPIVEVRQPSVDFRRTMSESQLDTFTEPMIDVYRNSSSALNSPTFEDAVGTFEGSEEMTSIDQTDFLELDDAHSSHKSKRERLHARASEMASKINEGASKLSDYWKNRHKSSTASGGGSVDVEFATEASESVIGDSPTKSAKTISPTPSFNKEANAKRKWLSRGRKSPTPSTKSHQPVENVPLTRLVPAKVYARSTKAVPLNRNAVWGQSLHFSLDKKDTKYLNLTVLARTPLPKDNSSQRSAQEELDNLKPTLLGSVSIYVPQIIADCQLTLSNCHCEVFALRPPSCNSFNMDSFGAISKHPGFDPRLCYGDISVRFRHFPDGLPAHAHQKYEDDVDVNDGDVEVADEVTLTSLDTNPAQSELLAKVIHQWTAITLKNASATCGLCAGKIWLKSGSRCKKCHLVCHSKCAAKNKHQECSNFGHIDDDNFEQLDISEIKKQPLRSSTASSSDTPPSPSLTEDNISVFSDKSEETTTRRRRLASKISSTLKSVGLKREKVVNSPPPIPKTPKVVLVKEVLEAEFMAQLQGSKAIYELYFEPGNSYNETVINKTRNLGVHVFPNEKSYYERKRLIDEQVDLIRTEIDRTASIRRDIEDKTGDDFEVVDQRMQALALLMLHYCAGMQDCDDNMTDSISHHSGQLLAEPTLPDIAE